MDRINGSVNACTCVVTACKQYTRTIILDGGSSVPGDDEAPVSDTPGSSGIAVSSKNLMPVMPTFTYPYAGYAEP